ncbi:MAG: adenylyltransferase/cytidyltransferase family protein, partial [Pseudomonadales bacterium]|nr:adenylyltransferase/cytidyltransferase family protein [Pseudomonadales bacterium]
MRIFYSPDDCRQALGPCVATIGKYDGMHLGHQRILDQVLALGEQLQLPTVVLLSEPQPEEFFNPAKAPARLSPFADKVEFLTAYGLDAVLRMDFNAALSQQSAASFAADYLGARLGLRALVVGDDFRFGRQRQGDFALLQHTGENLGFTVQAVNGY